MKRSWSWLVAGTIVVSGALAGCSGKGAIGNSPGVVTQRLMLEPFASCEELEKYIEDTAVRDMTNQLDDLLNNSYGGRGGIDAVGGAIPPQAAAAEGGDNASAAPSAYTKTNTQVAGVDEADFVKNDGTRIFVISGRRLYATTSWPASALAVKSSLEIEGYPQDMFLDEHNRLVVMSRVYTPWVEPGDTTGGSVDKGGADASAPCYAGGGDYWCGYGSTNTTKVTVFDVSDLAALKRKSEYYLPGSYSSSRRVQSSVRLVLTDSFRWPSGVKWYPEYDPANPRKYEDKNVFAMTVASMKTSNEKLIRDRALKDWLPQGKRKIEGGATVDVPYSCSDFSRANAPVKLGIVTVATLNLDKPDQDPSRTAVIGEAGIVYASQKSLYVATPHWWWWPRFGQSTFTYIHKFDITNADKATWVASGGVEGYLLDQFSMDEHEDALRVASTVETRVEDPEHPEWWWGRVETSNRVSVLAEQSGALAMVGKTADLAKGERIYSSRFLGKRGFVVTFRQIDPFFTLDLSDPTAPKVVGELKIPGFSTYLHPVDENHILAMGVYQPDPGEGGNVNWQERRMKLSLFDVSDFANPKEKYQQLIGTAYGWSEANYEHKAFNYFPERKLLAIPFSDWKPQARPGDNAYWDSFVSEIRTFSIDVNAGIAQKGAVSLRDVYQKHEYYGWTYYYTPWVRRSVMASDDQGNDFVYAISDAGIRVANLKTPSVATATALFASPKQ